MSRNLVGLISIVNFGAKRTATDFEKEIVQTNKKFLAANFPSRFINSVCTDFLNKENNQEINYRRNFKQFIWLIGNISQ